MDNENIAVHPEENVETDSGPIERNGIIFWGLLLASCIIFVFASVDEYHATPLTLYLNELFMSGRIEVGTYISVFDVIILIFTLVLLSKYGVDYSSACTTLKVIFLSAMVCWLLDMLNPNDHSRVKFIGLPLISEFSVYPYMFFMFTIFFMDSKAFTVFTRRIFLVLSWCFALRAIILLILWAHGKGNPNFYGIYSVLTEGDSLLIFAFFQAAFFALFLLWRKPSALVAWLLTVSIQALSYRRSAFFVAAIANAGTFALHVFFNPSGRSKLLGVVAGLLIVLTGFIAMTYLVSPEIVDTYLSRYLGIFNSSAASTAATDSGHFEETAATMLYAMQKMSFWGFGYGDPSRINVPGAYAGVYIHNVYAAAWVYHGIYLFLFYLMLLVTGIISLVIVLVRRLQHDWRFVLLTGTTLLYFASLAIVWLFSPIHIAGSLRMRLLWVFLVAFVFKTSSQDYCHLFLSDWHDDAGE